ncbi:MAG: hypothetical protein H6648_06660 [Caldilineae bacterium]|nr:hypothetical protein [Caldilineae bacterium]
MRPGRRAGAPARDAELGPGLARVGRALRRRDALSRASRWAWIGPAAALSLVILARRQPLPAAGAWALGLALGLPAMLAAPPLLRREPPDRTARRIDRALGLQDRLATAWYLGARRRLAAPAKPDDPAGLARRQRADAASWLVAVEPGRDLPWRPSRAGLGAAGLLAALTLAIGLTPNPQQAIRVQRAAVRAAALRSAQALAELRATAVAEVAAADAAAEAERLTRLEETLRGLERELAASRGRAEDDLAALAQAESRLTGLRDPAGVNRARRAEDLLAELADLAGPIAPAAADGATDAATEARGIADGFERALDAASGGEREARAEALDGLADRLPPELAEAATALREAAEAAREDRVGAAGDSVAGAVELAEAARDDADAAREVARALEALDRMRREIAAANAGGGEAPAAGPEGGADASKPAPAPSRPAATKGPGRVRPATAQAPVRPAMAADSSAPAMRAWARPRRRARRGREADGVSEPAAAGEPARAGMAATAGRASRPKQASRARTGCRPPAAMPASTPWGPGRG